MHTKCVQLWSNASGASCKIAGAEVVSMHQINLVVVHWEAVLINSHVQLK